MPGQQRPYAALEVGGMFIDAWTGFTSESDTFTPCDAFRLSVGVGTTGTRQLKTTLDKLRGEIQAGAVVKLYVGTNDKNALQCVGIADAREIENGRGDGTTFEVAGRDLGCLLVDSACPLELYKKNAKLVDVARAAVAPWADEPWSLNVRTDANGARDIRTGRTGRKSTRNTRDRAEALGIPAAKLSSKILEGIDNGTIDPTKLMTSRAGARNGAGISAAQVAQLTVKQAAVQAGETVWEFIERHCRRLGVLPRMGPDGTLVLAGIDYSQEPLYTLVRRIDIGSKNNILSGGERHDVSRFFDTVRVTGFGKQQDGPRKGLDVTVYDYSDDALSHEKVLIVHDDSIREASDAEKRAKYELAKSKQGSRLLHYTVRGFGQDGHVYATDTMCNLWDEVAGVKGAFYVIGRTFTFDMHNGAQTQLRMVPKDSIVLGDPPVPQKLAATR